MTTQWAISIDWDRDGNYTGTYDNVTDSIIGGVVTRHRTALRTGDRRHIFSPELDQKTTVIY